MTHKLNFIVTVLWSQRNELLHCTVRSLKSARCARVSRLGPRPRPANRKTQIVVHRYPHEILEGLIFFLGLRHCAFIYCFFPLSLPPGQTHHYTVGKNT